jgi:hypothetical protein
LTLCSRDGATRDSANDDEKYVWVDRGDTLLRGKSQRLKELIVASLQFWPCQKFKVESVRVMLTEEKEKI